jgi:hypothetical protein
VSTTNRLNLAVVVSDSLARVVYGSRVFIPREMPVSRFGCGGPQMKIRTTPNIPRTSPIVFAACGVIEVVGFVA